MFTPINAFISSVVGYHFGLGLDTCFRFIIACSFVSLVALPNFNNPIERRCYAVMLTFVHSVSDSNGRWITLRGYGHGITIICTCKIDYKYSDNCWTTSTTMVLLRTHTIQIMMPHTSPIFSILTQYREWNAIGPKTGNKFTSHKGNFLKPFSKL